MIVWAVCDGASDNARFVLYVCSWFLIQPTAYPFPFMRFEVQWSVLGAANLDFRDSGTGPKRYKKTRTLFIDTFQQKPLHHLFVPIVRWFNNSRSSHLSRRYTGGFFGGINHQPVRVHAVLASIQISFISPDQDGTMGPFSCIGRQLRPQGLELTWLDLFAS